MDDAVIDSAGGGVARWDAHIGSIASAGRKLIATADLGEGQLDAEFQRFLFSQISAAFVGRLCASAEHPDFWPHPSHVWTVFAPNPDACYLITPIDGDGVYRIGGHRGTMRIADMQVSGGEMYPLGRGAPGPTYGNYDLHALENVGEDGAFSVILSNERPAGYDGPWWPLDPQGRSIIVRQFAYDWLNERDGRFTIERLDRPIIRPRASADEIHDNLAEIGLWVDTFTKASLAWVARLRDQGLVNRVDVHDNNHAGGVTYQKYIEGIFAIGEDEALIYETEMPETCRYWNIQITDMSWSQLDWVNRQTSLNGHSAKIDEDGKLRLVLSSRDPGVANWLDTAGYAEGVILGRWTGASSAPTPTLKKVPFGDIARHLPAGTDMLRPEERDQRLRDRRRGAQLRRRW